MARERSRKHRPESDNETLMHRVRRSIAAKVALAMITGVSSGVTGAVAKAVLPEARLDAVKARLERLVDDPETGSAVPPASADQREALQDVPLEHLQAVAGAQGISYQDVDRDELVALLVASSQRAGRRASNTGTRRKGPARQPSPSRRKADLRRQQRPMGKRKSR